MTAVVKFVVGAGLIAYSCWRRNRRPDVDLHGSRFWTWQTWLGSLFIAGSGTMLIVSGVMDVP